MKPIHEWINVNWSICFVIATPQIGGLNANDEAVGDVTLLRPTNDTISVYV